MHYKEDSCEAAAAEPKHKERKIVTWTQEEDDILREQISIHGTDNWIIIASKFKDKTTRQCRRRWYTYLNSDFKKGGWSPEEDLLLCEAQKIFGNKWTEIAKVVSGRTDNAVKNRFTTLCKKKAKREVLAKENSASYINHNKKRIVVQLNGLHSEGALDIAGPLKKMRRTHITNPIESCNYEDINSNYCRATKQQPRLPFAVLAQKDHNVNNLLPQHIGTAKEALLDGNKKIEGTFLKKDDPKIIALVQQAQLLSSLALKVNSDNTEQSLENAWEIVQNFSNKSKETGEHLQHNEIKDLVEELKSGYHANQPSQRLPDIYESPSSSEYSTGSTSVCNTASEHQTEQSKVNNYMVDEDMGTGLHLIPRGDKNAVSMADDNLPTGTSENLEIIAAGAAENDGGVVSTLPALEFLSPPQVTPLFGSLAATIPSPQFSESERHFLMKTLGIESPIPNTAMNPSQPPPCRRALVHSL